MHVDDDSSILEISKQILVDINEHFVIDFAHCVDEALKKLATGNYDVVISDYEMPKKDGLQFLRELREQDNEIPFILFTGKGREEIIVKALNLGSDAYINKQGNPETVYGELSHSIVKTIERKNSKKLLTESESKYLRLFNTSEVGMFRTKLHNSEILECNEKLLQILGYTREEILGTPATLYYADADQRQELVKILQSKGQLVDSEIKLVCKLGEVKTCLLSSKLISEQGVLEGSIIDITERKKAEQAFARQNALFEGILASVNEGIFSVDTHYCHTSFNKRHAEVMKTLYGVDIEIGGNLLDYQTNPLDRKIAKNNIDKSLKGEFIIDEKASGDENLTRKWFEIRHCPVKNEKDEIVGVSIFSRDITERKKTEEEMCRSEFILQNTSDSIIITDFQGKIKYWNKGSAEIFGYSIGEMIGEPITKLLTSNDKERIAPLMLEQMGKGKTTIGEWRGLRKDGSTIWLMINSMLMRNTRNEPVGLVSIGKDITERKNAEESMRKSEERYRELANFLPVIVFEADLTGKITFFSKQAFELTGITPEDVEKGSNIISFVLPQDRERALENMKKSMAGEDHGPNEYTLVRKNGTRYPALVRTTQIISKNKLIGVRGLVIDITERKKAEMDLKESRDKLELMNEKLRVVGSLSRHDVRNKLSAVNGYTYLLKKKHTDQTDIVEVLEKIEQQVRDSAKIFEFAKMYEQLGVEELKYLDAGNAADEAMALFSGLTIKVVNDCHGVSVLADSFLRQMFYNFIDNTRKYGEKATAIKVYSEKEERRLATGL